MPRQKAEEGRYDLPETIIEAFRCRPLMPFPELVALLGVDRTTLRGHIDDGDLPCRQKGRGRRRPRRVFTVNDVAALFGNMRRKSQEQDGKWRGDEGVAMLPFTERTSSVAARAIHGTSNSRSPASSIEASAAPVTSERPSASRAKPKPRRKARSIKIEPPDWVR